MSGILMEKHVVSPSEFLVSSETCGRYATGASHACHGTVLNAPASMPHCNGSVHLQANWSESKLECAVKRKINIHWVRNNKERLVSLSRRTPYKGERYDEIIAAGPAIKMFYCASNIQRRHARCGWLLCWCTQRLPAAFCRRRQNKTGCSQMGGVQNLASPSNAPHGSNLGATES